MSNRREKSVHDAALALLIKDPRSGYAAADTQGRKNIRRNKTSARNKER